MQQEYSVDILWAAKRAIKRGDGEQLESLMYYGLGPSAARSQNAQLLGEALIELSAPEDGPRRYVAVDFLMYAGVHERVLELTESIQEEWPLLTRLGLRVRRGQSLIALGHSEQGGQALVDAMEKLRDAPLARRVMLQGQLGYYYLFNGKLDEAKAVLTDPSIPFEDRSVSILSSAMSVNCMSRYWGYQGEYVRGRVLLERMIRRAKEEEAPQRLTLLSLCLGDLLLEMGVVLGREAFFTEADQVIREGMALAIELKHFVLTEAAYASMASLHVARDESAAARECLNRIFDMSEAFRGAIVEVAPLANAGRVELRSGNIELARQILERTELVLETDLSLSGAIDLALFKAEFLARTEEWDAGLQILSSAQKQLEESGYGEKSYPLHQIGQIRALFPDS